jgi:hypothetical protein
MAQQKSNVQIVFTSDATQVTKDLGDMGKSSEQFSTKLIAVAESAKSLNKYIDGAAGGFVDYGSKSNKYLTSLSNQLANASLSAKELAIQSAKMNAMKFGGSASDVNTAGDLAAKIYDIKNASTQAATESDKLGAAIARVGHYGAAAFAFINVSDIVGKVVNVTAEFQRLEASLVTVEGSTSKASTSFDLIKTFAQKTPYQLTEVTDAFIKMKAMGLDASLESMQAYGDTASAMGKPIMQMIEAVADAATGEFERLKEFGIRVSSEGDKVKFTFKGVTTEVGKNSAEIEQYLIKLGQTNFGGGMARQMETLGGQLSNLQDNWANTFNTLGTVATPAISTAIGGLNNAANGVRYLAENLDTISAIAVPALTVGLTAKAIPAIWATATAATGAIGSIAGFTAALLAASRASMAFMVTPLGLALTTAGAAALYLSTKTDESANAVANLTEKAKALNIEVGKNAIKQQAEQLLSLQKELVALIELKKQNSAVDIVDNKENTLRQRIADIQNLKTETAELKTQSEMLLLQEVGMGSQLEMLNNQTKAFGISVDDVNKLIWDQGEAIASIKKPADEWDAAIELISQDFKKLHDQAAQDLANPTQEAFEQRKEQLRQAAEAAKAYADEQKKATAERLKWLSASQSADYDQFKGNLDLEEAYSKKITDQGKAIYDATRTGYEKLNIELSNLDQLYAQGAFDNVGGFDTYSRAIMDAYDKANAAGDKLTNDQKENMRELQQAIDGWGKDSARAVAEFALSGKGSFSDFANSVIKDLMTMMIYQNMTKPLMRAAGKWMSGLSGGVSDAGASTAAANGMSYWKDGGAFTPNVQAFANGGTFTNSIVDRPTPFKFANGGKFNLGVMGEAGAEAVMPLTRIGGKLGVLAQGGGSGGVTNVVVNVTNNAGETVQANATQSTNSNGETIIDVMIDKVKGAMMQDVGSNGQFSQAFAGAYGLSRRAF